MTREKGNVSSDVQKDDGSLVYNALSACAYEVERLYVQMDYIMEQSHASTADYDHLKLIAADRGLTPNEATYCEVKCISDVAIPIGTRFNLKSYNYSVAETLTGDNYTYRAICEQSGSDPNGLTGSCTMIDYVAGLTSCNVTETLVSGKDYETQADFYKRYLESFTSASFAGNVSAYKEQLKAISGVGGVKIYPVWNGGGTVKAVIQSSDWGVPSAYLISQIQASFCPTPSKGYGLCPIGHDFTAAAVASVAVAVTTKIKFISGYTYEMLKTSIEAKAKEYILSLCKSWESTESLSVTIYVAKLEAYLLDIEGIQDINSTTLNGSEANLTLGADEIPQVSSITVTTI